MSDGGAAAIVCSKDVLDRFNPKKAIRICASVFKGGTDRAIDDLEHSCCRRAANAAFKQAELERDGHLGRRGP